MKRLTSTDLCCVNYRAHKLADQAIVAYWLESADRDIDYHLKEIRHHFDDLAAQLGFVVIDPSESDACDTKALEDEARALK